MFTLGPMRERITPNENGPGARSSRPRRIYAGKLPAPPAYVHLSHPRGSRRTTPQ